MNGIIRLIARSRALQDTTFPLVTTDEEALALLPYWLNRQPDIITEDSTMYDQLRASEIPHSLKQLDWTIEKLDQIKKRYPEWSKFLDDAYHARRPSKETKRLSFLVKGIHAGRDATHRGADLDKAETILIAMHGRGAAADRLTHDLEGFIDNKDSVAIIAPQATDNAWYPNPAYRPPLENQPSIDDTLAVIDSLWALATLFVPSCRIVICGFSQGACAVLTWIRIRKKSPGAVLAFSGFQIEIGGNYKGLSKTYLYCSRSRGDTFCTDANIAKTKDDLKLEAPHAVIHTAEGERHEISEYDGQILRYSIRLAFLNQET